MIATPLRRAGLIRYWLPPILWSALLIFLSGRSGSGGVSTFFLSWLVPFSSAAFDPVHVFLRKTLHILAYGFLGVLDFRAVRGERSGWMLRWSIVAVLLTAVVAAIDEAHQSFVPGRTGTVSDAILDSAAASLAQFLIYRGSRNLKAR